MRLPRNRILRAAIYFVSLLLVLIAADLVWVQARRGFTPGYDTTRIVEPRLPDGRIDYLTPLDDLYGQGVTPQNNAAVLLIQALGRVALAKNQPPDGITDRIGMPHVPELGRYLIRWDDFVKDRSEGADPTIPDVPNSWPANIAPQTRRWVEANQYPLDLIVQASTRPRFCIPFYGGYRPQIIAGVLLPYCGVMREVGRLLISRAMIRLEGGDFGGFRSDLMAVHRWAHLQGSAPTGVERMVARDGLEVPACQAERAAAASGKLSAAQHKLLISDLVELGELPPMTAIIDGERYMVLDILQALATMPPSQEAELFNPLLGSDAIKPKFLFRFLALPYEQAMRQINHCMDGALAAAAQPDYPRRIAAMNLWQQANVTEVSDNVVLRLLSPQFPNRPLLWSVIQMEQRQDIGLMQQRLTEIALALAAFKADHGVYPAQLDQLSPAYLATIPDDFFVNKPVAYAPTANGYHLHSVGPDMNDNDGTGDDIVANLP